jgi:hypothetical protein
MKKFFVLSFVVSFVFLACSASAPESSPGDGGAPSSSSSSSSGAAACGTCSSVIDAAQQGGNVISAIDALCPEDRAYWNPVEDCGCSPAGRCWADCSAGLWCAGLGANPRAWFHPDGGCGTCVEALDGCGTFLIACNARTP